MQRYRFRFPLLFLSLLQCLPSAFSAGPEIQNIAERVGTAEKQEGFFHFYWNERSGQLLLEIDEAQKEFLLSSGAATGIGSNAIGIDRTQLADERLVEFRRVGPKVLLVEKNLRYRAGATDEPEEVRTVTEGFAESVLFSFPLQALEEGRFLIDLTPFLFTDQIGVQTRLREMKEGDYSVEIGRCALYLPRTRNFPDNSEFEAILTFQGSDPGPELRSVVPDPELITIRQHLSFIRLPDDLFQPRDFHVMSGYFPLTYRDYSVPIGEDTVRRLITRHRLEKEDPSAQASPPVEPIIYYLDPGVPEPVRTALIEGGSWWNEAFEAAGYRDAFRIELLPEDADPMDVRYNMINWLHRSTRGWSYGQSIVDPRTGEILKGHVNLGSLRVRQDYLIAEGLLAPYTEGFLPPGDPMLKMALARIRQLSAHEIGHTLGLAHNFAASADSRASVMDYPHPLVRLDDEGKIILDSAYAEGIGAWDKAAIAYGYQDFPDGLDEKAALAQILREAYDERGLRFITDQDARPAGGMHPTAHLWDNSADPIEELHRLVEIRNRALERLSAGAVRPGRPQAILEDVLVPTYFMLRYQAEAVVKVVGGIEYEYAVQGEEGASPRVVSGEEQRRALKALLTLLTPPLLELPESLLQKLTPRPPGYPSSRELVQGRTGPAFDPLATAEAAADQVVSLLLHPTRAARLLTQGARIEGALTFSELLESLMDQTWWSERRNGLRAELQRSVDFLVLQHLLALATHPEASMQVKALVHWKLEELFDYLDEIGWMDSDTAQAAANRYALMLLEQYFENPRTVFKPSTVQAPPGSPIGGGFCPW